MAQNVGLYLFQKDWIKLWLCALCVFISWIV